MKIDCVHFFVEDVRVFTNWLTDVFGWQLVSENTCFPWLGQTNYTTPLSNYTNYTNIVKYGSVTFAVSSSQYLDADHDVRRYLQKHPPGVGEISFLVDDLEKAIARIQQHGVKIITPLQEICVHNQLIRWIKIAAWGSLNHILVERRYFSPQLADERSLLDIDHIVVNVPAGELIPATTWYKNILDLQPRQSFQIQTEKSGLCSQVMRSKCGNVQIPINEPTTPNSQIQEFLNANNGTGIQHIALRLPNLIDAIAKFRQRGLQFLPVPASYYTNLCHRRGFSFSSAELTAIAQQQILVDWHDDKPLSPLLQIFTQPIFQQPTFFFEFIERRHQAQGFGEGNFRALFTAIESEQAKRGTLDLN